MLSYRLLSLCFLAGLLLLFTNVRAAEQSGGLPDGPGRDVLTSKCFQCHSEGMWKDQRQDRRGWEAALYRMVGRGALWTEDEINTMAAYLGSALGPQSAKTSTKE
ncbi:MAG TPA: hypothetical protein VL754_10610 [Verrucomicrobiae bacterium]|jgi:competence protein ComEA|nr:hypothetical protein [Verrucomicrobiae bacterium]